jgi:hypothetical protein
MADQDWETVTFSKSAKQKAAGLSSAQAVAQGKMSGVIATEKKFGAAGNKSAHTGSGVGLKKLEDSTEEFAHKSVGKELS